MQRGILGNVNALWASALWPLSALAALSLSLSSPAAAQEEPAPAPAADEIPPPIPTSAFASRAAFNSARLSPDGAHFAFTVQRDGKTYLSIYDADAQELVGGFSLEEFSDLNWFQWAGNGRILVSIGGVLIFRYAKLYVYDMATDELVPLQLPEMELDSDDIVHVDPDGEYVLASIAREQWGDPSVWRFDLGGEGPPEPQLAQRQQGNVFAWLADETGVVRIGLGTRRDRSITMRYRSSAEDEWEQVARTRIDREEFATWDLMGLRAGSDIGFSLAVPEGGDRAALMEFDFTTGEAGRVVHQSDDADITSVYFDHGNNPVAIGLSGETFRREWLDPDVATQVSALEQALPGSRITVIDMDADRSRMLVLQSGPADPGAIYVFTPGERLLDMFAELRPGVFVDELAVPQELRYVARDGTEIHGWLTLPRYREGTNLPLIMMPHGGPYGIRDRDSYDDWAQLLANRGYAVAQPNFRGSGGYGEAFERLGDGQVGRAMQDDLDDAVAYLVEQGVVDPERVCIVGASYGGFAAMWGAIRNPEIYRCAASWAGVTHFERQLSHDRDYLFGRSRGRHVRRIDGDQTNFDLDDVSPAVQVRRLTRPLLLAHGERDNRVPFDQYELMVDRAEDADIAIETLVLEESGHSFGSAEDEQAFYDALLEFLERHNPAN